MTERIVRINANELRKLIILGCVTSVVTSSAGCTSWFTRKKTDETRFIQETKRIKEVLSSEDRPRLIGEVSGVSGLTVYPYDSYGLVTGLNHTGGIVRPGRPRDMMLMEMRRRNVRTPEQLLDSSETALVKVRAYGDPGMKAGAQLDLLVEGSTESDATDLDGGTLLEVNLREMVDVGTQIRESEDRATGAGELVFFPTEFTKRDREPLRALIIGGGRLLHDRRLSILIKPDYKHVLVANEIVSALNGRFYFHEAAKQKLVAEGKSDFEVAIKVPPKYQADIAHFSSVILACGFNETKEDRNQRVEGCRKLLEDRTTSRRAAAELEALGTPEAIEVLKSGLSSLDTEIRFYSAYSLAYLDQKEATPVLAEIAKKEAAFRPLCLVGLTATAHASGREALTRLLQDPTPELRYGAFWAIRNRDSNDSLLYSEKLTGNATLSLVSSDTSLIAVSLQTKPEIVVFGKTSPVSLTSSVSPTSSLSLTPMPGSQIRIVKRFQNDIYNATVDSDLLSLVRTMGSMGANYNDIVQTLNALQARKAISTPVAFNPRPMAGRIYNRDGENADTDSPSVVEVDGSSRAVEAKSWWDFTSWMSKSTVSVPKKKTDSNSSLGGTKLPERLPTTDLDSKAKMVHESITGSGAGGSDELPPIDWESL